MRSRMTTIESMPVTVIGNSLTSECSAAPCNERSVAQKHRRMCLGVTVLLGPSLIKAHYHSP